MLALPKLKKEMQSAVEDFTRQIIEQVSIRTNIGNFLLHRLFRTAWLHMSLECIRYILKSAKFSVEICL